MLQRVQGANNVAALVPRNSRSRRLLPIAHIVVWRVVPPNPHMYSTIGVEVPMQPAGLMQVFSKHGGCRQAPCILGLALLVRPRRIRLMSDHILLLLRRRAEALHFKRTGRQGFPLAEAKTSTVPASNQHRSSIVPASNKHRSSLVPASFQHRSIIVPASFQHLCSVVCDPALRLSATHGQSHTAEQSPSASSTGTAASCVP